MTTETLKTLRLDQMSVLEVVSEFAAKIEELAGAETVDVHRIQHYRRAMAGLLYGMTLPEAEAIGFPTLGEIVDEPSRAHDFIVLPEYQEHGGRFLDGDLIVHRETAVNLVSELLDQIPASASAICEFSDDRILVRAVLREAERRLVAVLREPLAGRLAAAA